MATKKKHHSKHRKHHSKHRKHKKHKKRRIENTFRSILSHLFLFSFISSPTDLDSTHRRIEIISILIVILIMAPPLGGAIKLWDPRYIGIFTNVRLGGNDAHRIFEHGELRYVTSTGGLIRLIFNPIF